MSTLLWNYRGLGNVATLRELREFSASILCVVETQISKDMVESLAASLGFDNTFVVNSTCRSGGLGIFWNTEIRLDLLPYS
jgi:hypothetical protein